MFRILKIRRDERWLAVVATVLFALLNALTVVRYYGSFSVLSNNYRSLFVKTFRISGFDPLTYQVVSQWDAAYNVHRHPLLAFFVYPLTWLNKLLISATGQNWVSIVVALFLVFCSVFSCIFLYRIVREVVGAGRRDAYLLCAMYFSFAFVMLSTMVPDHFVMSMAALLFTLYVAGVRLKEGRGMTAWHTLLLFVVTGGISLNNGLKVFMASIFTRFSAQKERLFSAVSLKRWALFLIFAVLLPSGGMWKFAKWEYKTYVWPQEMARKKAKAKKKTAAVASVNPQTDKAEVAKSPAAKPRKTKHKAKRPTPISQGEFMRWTDISTNRWDTGVENLFGEAIQLHEKHLLGDVYRGRPAIVRYGHWYNYAVEALVLLLFLAGVWVGRRSRFLWLALSFFFLDMALHMGLGFGIDEIYIMSPHYLYVMPIAMAFLLRATDTKPDRKHHAVRGLVVCLTAWLLVWNVCLIVQYLYF